MPPACLKCATSCSKPEIRPSTWDMSPSSRATWLKFFTPFKEGSNKKASDCTKEWGSSAIGRPEGSKTAKLG